METKSLAKKLDYFTHASNKENIGPSQRIFSIIGGAYMLWSAASSLASKKKTGIVKPLWNAVSGGYLLYRGVRGHCPLKDALKEPQNKLLSSLHKN